jgi:hypothetical protein
MAGLVTPAPNEGEEGNAAASPVVVHLRPEPPLPGARVALGGDDWPFGLARAIAHSPGWPDGDQPIVVVRVDAEAPPYLAVIGTFDEGMQARLRGLGWLVRHQLPRLRYVDYREAERLVEALAARLVDRLGRDALEVMGYVAVPRGGHIVLGMLAYALGLDQARLEPPFARGTPLVVVDDIVISGNRLRRFLASRLDATPVVFASLFASRDVRGAIEADPRVRACLAAEDVRDLAPEQEGDAYAAWLARWQQRGGDDAFAVNRPEPVAFAWNEPDVAIWNDVTNRVENPWRLLPPEACLKRRGGLPQHSIEVRRQPVGSGSIRPAPDAIFTAFEGATLLSRPASPSPLMLDGSAEVMWHAIVRHGEIPDAAAEVAKNYGASANDVTPDLEALVANLTQRGMLVRQGGNDR